MGPVHEIKARQILQEAGIDVVDVNVTPGGCCRWHLVTSIRKKPGDSRKALLFLLSSSNFKHVVVTSEEIDIHDPEAVEWAIATRVQVDRHVTIIPGHSSHRSAPSLPVPAPVVAKMGIDATIPDDAPPNNFGRIRNPFGGKVSLGELESVVSPSSSASSPRLPEELAEEIARYLSEKPMFYSEVLANLEDVPYRSVVQAMNLLRTQDRLTRDADGRYVVC